MCQFPAKKWLKVRRAIAALADETEDPGVVRLCCRMVLDIDHARLDHMETGCPCWYEAIDAAVPAHYERLGHRRPAA